MKSYAWILGLCLVLELVALPAQAGCNSWTKKADVPNLGYGVLFCPSVEFDEFPNCDAAHQIAEQVRDKLVEKHPSYKITLGECGRTASSLGSDFGFTIEFNDPAVNVLNRTCEPFANELARNPTFVKNVCKKDNDGTDRFMKYVSPEVLGGKDQSILAPGKDGDAGKGN